MRVAYLLLILTTSLFAADVAQSLVSQLTFERFDKVFNGATGVVTEVRASRKWAYDENLKKDVFASDPITYFEVSVGPQSTKRGCRPASQSDEAEFLTSVVLTHTSKAIERTKLVESYLCRPEGADQDWSCYLFSVNGGNGSRLERFRIAFRPLDFDIEPCLFRLGYAPIIAAPEVIQETPEEKAPEKKPTPAPPVPMPPEPETLPTPEPNK